MADDRFYPGWGKREEELRSYLEATYRTRGYQTQSLPLPGGEAGGILQVQERYEEGWQRTLSTFTGMDTAATVSFKVEGDGLSLSIGGGKWLDKAAVAGVGAVMSAGLLFIPAGIGAFKQSKLLQDILTHVEAYVRVQSQGKKD